MNAEPMYRELHNMGKRMVTGIPALESLKGKDAVLILGPTGSGKSTVANALISGVDKLEKVDDDEWGTVIKTTEPLVVDGKTLF